MIRFFMFQDDTSHKFWEINVLENKQSISFGRVGSVGTLKEKVFETPELCLADSLKVINEKVKKGYLEIEKSIKIAESDNATPNDKISSYLKAQLDSYKSKLKATANLKPLFSELFQKIEEFDFESYKKQAEKEIETNLVDWWTNPSKGINPEEMVYSILFEYDYYLAKNVEAHSYGIVSWEDFKLHTKSFDMGYSYDFSAGFEASPGITLNFFDNLEIFHDWDNLPDDIDGNDLYYMEGYQELLKTYLFSGLVALNEVFKILNSKGIFKKIKSKKGFMFMIGEHDMGEVFPIFALE
ncbi:MAG: WGR domain-containing protein [Leadbetterella sp.]